MLWLALHLPLLPLEAFCASLPPAAPGAEARAVVLIDQHRVHSVNQAAAARGIRPGIKRTTALALVADLLVADSNAAREAAALQAVVHAALAYTPSVCLHGSAPEDRHLGAWAAEGVEAKRAKNECHSVSICKPRVDPWAQQAIPEGAVFSRVAADGLLPPTLLGRHRFRRPLGRVGMLHRL